MKIRNFLCFLLLIAVSYLQAQVTTSGMNGKVTVANNESLPGATVMAIHVPSGTQYGTITDPDGYYNFSNMRVGGPYTLKVSFVGFKTTELNDITLNLGQTQGVNVNLVQES